jgi:hypothetical protein
MSGQLVGEVLAAWQELRERKLSERAFHALIAIAEKADTQSRQASVRWDHIRAGLYGASKRTAERAVQDLRDAKIVDLVQAGYKNMHQARAPRYVIRPLVDADTQVSVSTDLDHDTQVSASKVQIPTNRDLDTDKTGVGSRHPGVVLDVYLTEFLDGGTPPPRFCPAHMPDGTTLPCVPCGHYRERHETWNTDREDRRQALRGAIRRSIDKCKDCTDAGRLDDLSDCPKHPNFRRFPQFAARTP